MRLPSWWSSRFLTIELIIGAVLVVVFASWTSVFSGAVYVDKLMTGTRIGLYGTLAAIFGSLLGFVIATLAIVLGFGDSERLGVLRRSAKYPVLWQTLLSTTRWLALATIGAIAALVVDRDGAQNLGALDLCLLFSVVAALRLARSIWILQNVVAIVTSSSPARGPAPSP